MPSSPVSITVPAVADVNLHGAVSASFMLPVHNGGTQPLTLTASAAELTTSARAHPAAGFTFRFSPDTFTVRPGATRDIRVFVTVPAHDGGQHITDFVLAARTTAVSGAGHLAAAVATRVEFTSPGRPLATVPKPVTATGQLLGGRPAGFPYPAAGGAALGAVVLVAATGLILRRRARTAAASARLRRQREPRRTDPGSVALRELGLTHPVWSGDDTPLGVRSPAADVQEARRYLP
jgi:hypothetical protein